MDSPYVEHIRRAIISARGVEPLMYPTVGGSLPNCVFTKILGKLAFVVPYANADEANHAPNENLEILRFIDGVRTGAALLEEIGSTECRRWRCARAAIDFKSTLSVSC